MTPNSPSERKHSVGFWVCVGSSVLVVLVSWVLILQDRVSEDGMAIKQDVTGVLSEVRTVEMNTRPEREDVSEVYKAISKNFNTAVTRAKKQKQAIETVSPFFEEQIK